LVSEKMWETMRKGMKFNNFLNLNLPFSMAIPLLSLKCENFFFPYFPASQTTIFLLVLIL